MCGIEIESVTTTGWTRRGVAADTIKPVLKNTGSHDNDNGAKRRVTKQSGLGGAKVMGEQDEGNVKWKKLEYSKAQKGQT